MSDDEFMMDAEDYGFEYESEDEDQPDVNLENQYYNAKALKEDEPRAALEAFQEVVSMEKERGEWGFRALKQLVKLQFKLGQLDRAMSSYRSLLGYIKSAVTRNYSEKSINNLLDYVSSSQQTDFMEEFYQTTLQALENDAKNERLSFKANLKLAKLWLDRAEYNRLGKILRQLHASCQTEDGTEDAKKGTQLLEVYALEIQMHTATKNTKKLKALYQRSLRVKSAIPHPRIMGVIRECGGKMHILEGQWENANKDFFEAFKNYDESGSPRRIQCLKYLVLSNMLMQSEIDPFTAPETKPHKNHPEIVAMTNLVTAYQRNEIKEFERILRENQKTIMEDSFIRDHVEMLLKNIRTQVLVKLIKPYTRLNLSFIAEELNLQMSEIEALLVSLILDQKIEGRIDQVARRLELKPPADITNTTYEALETWSSQLPIIQNNLVQKLA